MKKIDWKLLLVLAVSLVVRTIKLDYLEMFGDEVDAGYQSFALGTNLTDYKGNFLPSYLSSFSEQRAPGLMYAMIPFIKIFGLNEWGVRLTPVFFGIILIWGWWKLMEERRENNSIKILSSLLLAIIPWQVQYSRTAFELTMMTSSLIWGYYFWIRRRWFWTGVLFALAIYTYNTANVLVLLLVGVSYFVDRFKIRSYIKLGIVGIVFCLPIIYQFAFGKAGDRFKLFSLWNNKEITAQVDSLRNGNESKYSSIFYNKISVSVKKFSFNYMNAFSVGFLANEGDVTFRHSLHYVGNIYWAMLPLIVLGLVNFIKRSQNLNEKIMLGWLLIAPIPAALTVDGYNHASRLFFLSIPLCYWAAKGFDLIKNNYLRIGLVGLIVAEFINYQYFYWNNYRMESWKWWHTGYKELMTAVKENRTKYQRVMIENTYEPALIRYLFWNAEPVKEVMGVEDSMNQKIDGIFEGFSIKNIYFVNYVGKFDVKNLQKETLYSVSQEKNIGGDWDWEKNPPEGIKVVKAIRNYNNNPIFYLVEKK